MQQDSIAIYCRFSSKDDMAQMPTCDGRQTSTISTPGTSIQEQAFEAASLHTVMTGSNETIISANKSMFFLEMNPFAPVSVVLLHMLYLPCHSKSRNVCKKEEYSVGLCADLVAEMIREHAHDRRAHVVGVGTSGFIALDIVRRHPDVVTSGFISGAWPQKGMRLTVTNHPRLLYAGLWSILHSPGSLFFKMSGYSGEYHNDELLNAIKRNGSSRLAEAGCSYAKEWQEVQFAETGVADKRLCMIAGGKQDDPEGVRQAAKLLKSQSSGGQGSTTCAYQVREAILAWNLQFPPLFAKAIQCWIEHLPMPDEFEDMPI
ncbi:hypothetical protein N8I77_009936 [Diaporthe amygdali]|uniref:Uncharacterized protein n=1 Tax=Phomopsis amygdali TaxID=1214568 RepID=A0AAD9VYQ3_PHOAM|nr:hypothetical protein N8I77_009936 [Diaporthe amygdali]